MDGAQVEVVARRLSALAGEVRAVADRLGAGAGVRWESLAAQRFRDRLAEESVRVDRAASGLDDAAAAVHAHAAAVSGALGHAGRLL